MLRGSSHDSDSDDQMHHGLARQLGELLVGYIMGSLGLVGYLWMHPRLQHQQALFRRPWLCSVLASWS
jgi:hypothetical protein